jgi:peroxiredoxin
MVKTNDQKQLTFDIIPDFTLKAVDGRIISPSLYRNKKNLVLVFVQFSECSTCYTLLSDLKKFYKDFRGMNTEVLLIIGCSEKAVKNLQQLWMMPFPMLADTDDLAARQYLGDNIQYRPALLIVDQYGLVWKYFIGKNKTDIKPQNILKWLEFIEIQCPECGVKDGPVNDKNEVNLSLSKKIRGCYRRSNR